MSYIQGRHTSQAVAVVNSSDSTTVEKIIIKTLAHFKIKSVEVRTNRLLLYKVQLQELQANKTVLVKIRITMETKSAFKLAWFYRNVIIVILVPIILLPLPLILDSKEAKCGYAILIMAIYWITEALPIPVTSLLPVILFPMLEVVPAKEISKFYVNDTTMLFVGGLLMAIAIETWQLHKRIALRILMLFGSEPRWLILGLMLNTWFLSMWISNTATTAMMMPIAEAVLQQLKKTKEQEMIVSDNLAMEISNIEEKSIQLNNQIADQQDIRNLPSNKESSLQLNAEADNDNDKNFSRLCKAVCLSIAYAANTGGTGTLTGTPPNLVLRGQVDELFGSRGLKTEVTFANWMLLGVPLSAINIILTWIWLQAFFLRCKGFSSCCGVKQTEEVKRDVKAVVRREYEKLGSMSFAEIMVFILFITLALLWITRDLQAAGGWGLLFGKKFASDSTPAILIGVLLIIIPSEIPTWKTQENNDDRDSKKPPTLLTWPIIHEKLPWGIVILLGGGFALANASKVSGLSSLISQQLILLSSMTPWVMNMILAFIVSIGTEVTSNTATATLLMPIMAELALGMNLNPLYLMITAALACSFAFMLPVATPPNAIVFSGGHLKVSDMASAGLFVNIFCVLTLTLAVNTWGDSIFDFHHVPHAFFDNTTLITTLATSNVSLP